MINQGKPESNILIEFTFDVVFQLQFHRLECMWDALSNNPFLLDHGYCQNLQFQMLFNLTIWSKSEKIALAFMISLEMGTEMISCFFVSSFYVALIHWIHYLLDIWAQLNFGFLLLINLNDCCYQYCCYYNPDLYLRYFYSTRCVTLLPEGVRI